MATFQDDQLNGNGREISHEKQTFSHVSRFAPKPFHRFPIFQPRTTPSYTHYIRVHIHTYICIYVHTYAFHFPREKNSFARKFFVRSRSLSISSSRTNYDQRIRSIFIFSRNRSVSPTYVAAGSSARVASKRTFSSPLFLSLAGLACNLRVLTYLLTHSLLATWLDRGRVCVCT